MLGHARLVTVTGPGGVGKTRLALRAAARAAVRFGDGVCLADLSGLSGRGLVGPGLGGPGLGEPGLGGPSGPGRVAAAVAAALGLPERPGQPALDTVLAHLRGRHLLLILDTCEHLVDACALFAEAVIAQAPRVTILATSREPLDVSGENACPLGPLPVPPADSMETAPRDDRNGGYSGQDLRGTAIELFCQRAAAAVPGFTVGTAELPALAGLCRRLDGMPLAIELAAVRLRALPLAELAGRLDEPLALLTSGHRGGRHRTLRGSIGWSHDLCTPGEQALWARLSVFAGPFTMRAAEEIGGEPGLGPVLPLVVRLVDKSVLIRVGPAAGGGQPARYLMPAAIREFGAERLAAAEAEQIAAAESEPAGHEHTGHEPAGHEPAGPGRAVAAAGGRLVVRYLAMAERFRDHFLDDDQGGLLRELRLEHDNLGAALQYALGGGTGGGTGTGTGTDGGGDAGNRRPVDAAGNRQPGRHAGNRQPESDAGNRRPEAESLDRAGAGVALATALSGYWLARGLSGEGSDWLGRAVSAAEPGSAAQGAALAARGRLRAMRGEAGLALGDASRARDIAAGHGDHVLAGRCHLVESIARCVRGDLAGAAAAAGTARRLLTAARDPGGLSDLDAQLGYLALLNGDVEGALEQVEDGLRRLGGSRERWLHARLYLLAALALYRGGRDIEARWTATRALRVRHETGDIPGTAFALEVLGCLSARSGGRQRTAWLLGGADALWRRAGGRHAASMAFEPARAAAAAGAAAALGDERFADLFARGRGLPPGQLVALALNEAADPDGRLTGSIGPVSDAEPRGNAGTDISLPGQLTAREREIASLVGAGLSNRQIAERLFISRRTVDAHLEHIFGKLGITSRVMLAIQLRDHSAGMAANGNA
jgi:predicted ATPase/DNA-binding CsgD family transcriptional regulator